MEWLDFEMVVALHDEVAVPLVGPPHESLDLTANGDGDLRSALERPLFYQHYQGEKRLSVYAAIYLCAVVKAHAFQQGNKRTALLAMRQFLVLNGQPVALAFPPDGGVQEFVYRVADEGIRELGHESSSVSLEDAAAWVESLYA